MESANNMGPVSRPAVDVRWSATYETHDSTVTGLNCPCQGQPVLQTKDGTGSGMSVSKLLISEVPERHGVSVGDQRGGGNVQCAADVLLRDVRRDHVNVDDDNVVNESLAVASTYAVLIPTRRPGPYRGSHDGAALRRRRGWGGVISWIGW